MSVRTNPADKLKGYKPLDWSGPSKLSTEEQEIVDLQRKDLWLHGIRREPMLTCMAFEFAAVICAKRRPHREREVQALKDEGAK